MDADKFAYFVAKYRACGEEELADVARRASDLADEAAAALRQVVGERDLAIPDPKPESTPAVKELSEVERGEQTRVSTDLWNSALSRRVQFQFGAMAIVFSFSLLGPQGLRAGVLWLLLLASGLYYVANKAGRIYTRSICANAEKTIDEKRSALRSTSLLLWPVLLVPAFLGVVLASALRGS